MGKVQNLGGKEDIPLSGIECKHNSLLFFSNNKADTVLNVLQILTHLVLTLTFGISPVIIPMIEMRKLRNGEVT